jgi:hypothetical protein
MPELDAMNPEMDPQQTAGTPDGGTDREGAMAKADLYKLANYSHKLFQQMHDDDQLEAWVQAKITKAADYIASVYHYLEYEMKFSEYGHHLDNSDTLSEGQKMKLKEVLAEAKMKMADLKKSQAEKIKEEKSSTGGEITRSKGVTKHKENPNRYSDEEHGEVASNVKSQSAAQKREKAPEQKFSPKKDKTWGMKGSEKFDHRDKELEENMEPCEHCGGAGHVPKAPVKVHPDHAGKVAKYNRQAKAFHAASKRIDANNNGIPDEDEGLAESTKEKCNHTAKGKSCPVHGLKECSMEESKLPMKKVGGKSVPAFAADGKGKNDLSKKKDVKEAAKAMWKNIKETTAYVAEKAEVEKKAKRDYDEDGTIETGKAEHTGSVDKAIKASKAKETVKESVDMTRLRELTKHLLG